MGATTVEVSTNHVAMVSHPDEVLQLIKTAAEAGGGRKLSAPRRYCTVPPDTSQNPRDLRRADAVCEAGRTVHMRPPRPRPSGRYAVRSET